VQAALAQADDEDAVGSVHFRKNFDLSNDE